MNCLAKLRLRFRALLQKEKLDADMAEEMRGHIEMRMRENIEAGMSADEARYAAMRQFGWAENIKETCREQRGVTWLEHLIQDLRYGARMLRKNPGFTAVAVLTLALGIGANTAVFSIVNGVLLKPLPYREPDKLVRVFNTFKEQGWDRVGVTAPAFVEWRKQNTVFEGIAATRGDSINLTGLGEPERVFGQSCSASLFQLLGVKPILGRPFTSAEEEFGKHRVVMLTYRFWQRHFNADPSVVGHALTLNGEPWDVIGVLPASFKYHSADIELWTPLAFPPWQLQEGHDSHNYDCIARLKPGVTMVQASAEMNAIHARLVTLNEAHRGWGVNFVPLQDVIVGDSRRSLLVLLGAVGFVLLIACVNVANLLLARAASRTKEFAIRSALGAARGRVIGQILTESTMLALIGGLLGWFVAFGSVQAFVASAPRDLPRVDEIGLDTRVFAFGLLVSLATGIIFGLAPAFAAAHADLSETLKTSERGSSEGSRGNGLRSSLVVAEVTLSLVLLVGAGLLIRSFLRLQEVDPGFRPAQVVVANISLSSKNYPNQVASGDFFMRLQERLASLPGVESAALAFGLPLQMENANIAVRVEGRPEPKPNEPGNARYLQITPDFFRAMGTPLLRGRDFTSRDTTNTPLVAIVNERFVRTFFPKEDPLGKRLSIGDGPARWTEIIGVVRDVRHESVAVNPEPAMYLPMSQRCWGLAQIVVRTAAKPISIAQMIRQTVLGLDSNQPVQNIRAMQSMVDETIAGRRLQMFLLSAFGAVALALAAIGISGVITYGVARRTREIGVRMALGAQMRDVLRLILGQGMKPVSAGLGLGVLGALGLTRLMSKLLFEIRPADPATFIVVIVLLGGVALAACWLPARRASKIEPMVALRYE